MLPSDPPPRRNLWLLVTSAGLAGAAASTRWIGFTVILSGSLVLLLTARAARPARARLRQAVLFGLAAALPLTAIVSLNQARSGHWAGSRSELDSFNPLIRAVELFAKAQISREFVIPWIVLLTALAVMLAVRRVHGHRWFWPHKTAPFAVFALVYSVALIVADQVTEIEVQDRYVLPASLALLLAACELLDKAICRLGSAAAERRRANRLLCATSAVTSVIVFSLLTSNLAETRYSLSLGIPAETYSGEDAVIRDSDILDYLQENPVEGMIHSNRPEPIYWFTGHQPVRAVIRAQGADCVEWFEETTVDYVVWFADLSLSDPEYFDVLRCDVPAVEGRLPQLHVLYRSEDGVVYRAG